MKKGRPRQFDEEEVIDKAMRVFWKKGYDGASLGDLTSAMGLSRPSLYAAFGDKRSLFLRTLDRYRESPASYVNRALAKPTACEVFHDLLHGVVDLVTDADNPGGCLFVSAALSGEEGPEPIREELADRRRRGERDILKRFQRAAREGDLPAGTDPKTLAKLAATLLWGISIQGVNGSSRKDLLKVAEAAIRLFPGTSKKP